MIGHIESCAILYIYIHVRTYAYIYISHYGDDSSQSQSSTRDLGKFTGNEGQSGKNMCRQGGKPPDTYW